MNPREVVWALAFLLFDREEGRPGWPLTVVLAALIVVGLGTALTGGVSSLVR